MWSAYSPWVSRRLKVKTVRLRREVSGAAGYESYALMAEMFHWGVGARRDWFTRRRSRRG
jgi:hypothetical protein